MSLLYQSSECYDGPMPKVYPNASAATRTSLLERIMGASTIGRMVLTGEVKRTDVITVEESIRLAKAPAEDQKPRTMRLNPLLAEDF